MSKITDAELERLRSRIGSTAGARDEPYLTEVTRDSIRHWAWGTGDRNPLYLDKAYAQSAGHADVVGPPAMLYAFSRHSVGFRGGLPGVHSVFGGSHWKWHKRLTPGMQITPASTLTALDEMPSKFAGRMFKQLGTTRFDDGNGPVAEVESWTLRFERSAARERNPEKQSAAKNDAAAPGAESSERASLSAEVIAQITEEYRKEAATAGRGSDWAAVEVGGEIPSLIRGPYSSTCAVAFEMAWGGAYVLSHGYWYEFLSKHPGASLRSEEGVPETAESVHWDARAAKRAGVASSYDLGPERVAWLATLLTNWAGPRGFLSELYCEVRGFNVAGNLMRCNGRVMEKQQGDGKGIVRVDVEAVDAKGKVTAFGWGKVEFPLD